MVIYSNYERGDDRMDVIDAMKEWKAKLDADPSNKLDDHNYVSDLLYEVWTPKWKWFKPPMRRIFRWAYSIEQTLLTNVYPSSINLVNDDSANSEVDITFNANFPKSEKIEALSNEFKIKFMDNTPRGADTAIIHFDDPWMDVCRKCELGPLGHILHIDGCPNMKYCMRVYHEGHVDGVYEEGTRTDQYRGSKSYYDKEAVIK